MNEITIPDGIATSVQWIKLDKFTVEYNPKRYDLYASLFTTNDKGKILSMKMSPMFEFIFSYHKCKRTGKKFIYTDTRYYKMQRLYGRTHSYSVVKISNFIKLYNDISKNGLKKNPMVLPEEDGIFQIKDGHHRIACCIALGYVKIICRVIVGQMK